MEVPDLPARQVVSRSPVRTVRVLNMPGIFPRPVECESSLERDFVFRIALCPGVVDLKHQPFQLTLKSGRRYTPDFLARHADGTLTVVEVKMSGKVEEHRALFNEATQELESKQVAFVVAHDKAIRDAKAHERAYLILRYRKSGLDVDIKTRVLAAAKACPQGVSISRLRRDSGASRQDVLHLLAARQLHASRLHAIEDNDLVFPTNIQGLNHEHRLDRWLGLAPWTTHP